MGFQHRHANDGTRQRRFGRFGRAQRGADTNPHCSPPAHARRGPPHLYLAIYKAFLWIMLVSVGAAIITAKLLWSPEQESPPALVTKGAALLLEGMRKDVPLDAALEERAELLGVELGLYDADGRTLAKTSPDARAPDVSRRFQWMGGPGRGGFALRLDDGRFMTLVAEERPRHFIPFALALLALLVMMAVATHPVARRITRRLEALETGMQRFGAGHLESRVEVVGRDEVARVAMAFNRAAAQVQTLVGQQQRMLASASHELRAPLSRLRMALELAYDEDTKLSVERRARVVADSAADIEELDALVSDLLMAARLSHPDRNRAFETVDLAELARAECRRLGLECAVADVTCVGERGMLRRMIRNLLDNARKYGAGSPVSLTLERDAQGQVALCVLDRGPGVPEADRERIFEPFYRPQGHAETRDGGVGLGLSLVRQIAHHHGGDVAYLPRDGGGSCFRVRFPAEPNHAPDGEVEGNGEGPGRPGRDCRSE